MRIWQTIDRARTPEKTDLVLSHSEGEFLIRANGRFLMSSSMHGSEEALATLGCEYARRLETPAVLIGGLGIGFTLRAALDVLPAGATVVVAELLAAVVAWNRGPLAHLARSPLEDPRVVVEVGDVMALLPKRRGRFDAIMMDVDNGPAALSQEGNSQLYGKRGTETLRRALVPDGTLAVWSAAADEKYERQLKRGGFDVASQLVRAHDGRDSEDHVIFLGRKRDDGERRGRAKPERPVSKRERLGKHR